MDDRTLAPIDLWLTEEHRNGLRIGYRVRRTLFAEREDAWTHDVVQPVIVHVAGHDEVTHPDIGQALCDGLRNGRLNFDSEGDHFGHYSHAADYPVFRVHRVLARKDAIYPATVVGKPVQEDFYMGEALQEMTLPLLKMIRPAVTDLWAYPETGFHALAVMSVAERYPQEALKHTLGMLGEGQVSLTKVMITVDHRVNVRRIEAVSRALWQHLDAATGIHLLAPTAQDTLDFTGPAMNTGSRLRESHRPAFNTAMDTPSGDLAPTGGVPFVLPTVSPPRTTVSLW